MSQSQQQSPTDASNSIEPSSSQANLELSMPISAFRENEKRITDLCFGKQDELCKLVPFFDELEDSLKKRVSAAAELRVFDPKQDLFAAGDLPPAIVVLQGCVALVEPSSKTGRELIVAIISVGSLLGMVLAIGGGPGRSMPGRYMLRAMRSSKVMIIPRPELNLIVDNSPRLNRLFLESTVQHFSEVCTLACSLTHDSVPRRIACTILSQVRGTFATNGQQKLYLSLTRQELADMVGTTLESAVRATRAMEQDGILDLSRRGRIVIQDLSKLKSLCG